MIECEILNSHNSSKKYHYIFLGKLLLSLEFENNGILQQQKNPWNFFFFLNFFKFFEKQILESLLLLRRANCYPIFVMMLYQHLKSVGTMSFVTQLTHLSFSVTFNGAIKSSNLLILNYLCNKNV